MLDDNEHRRKRHQNERQRDVAVCVERQCNVGKGGHGGDRSQRDVTKGEHKNYKDGGGQQNRFGSDHEERTESGGDSLSSAELQPDWKHMSSNSKECGQGGVQHKVGGRGGQDRAPGSLCDGDSFERGTEQDAGCDGSRPFWWRGQQRENPECGRFARYVGGANVAAAGETDVFATKNTHEEISERDGAQQVTGGGDLE